MKHITSEVYCFYREKGAVSNMDRAPQKTHSLNTFHLLGATRAIPTMCSPHTKPAWTRTNMEETEKNCYSLHLKVLQENGLESSKYISITKQII